MLAETLHEWYWWWELIIYGSISYKRIVKPTISIYPYLAYVDVLTTRNVKDK
jgi:hypothetical protein